MRRVAWLVSTVVAFALTQVWLDGQKQDPEELARARLNTALQELKEVPIDPDEQDRFYLGVDALTLSVLAEVDTLVASRIPTSTSSQAAEAKVRRLLMDHKPGREYTDEAFVRVGDSAYGRSLVAAYSIVRGPHHDLAVIHGYRETAERKFQLVSQSADFEGRTMNVRDLRSPLSSEIWFLLWGRVHAANGSWVYAEALAFDGKEFRVLWHPEPMDRGEFEVTKGGFAVTHFRHDLFRTVRDEYVITPNGPLKISQGLPK